mmetsp:Transcript_14752/g.16373  ORF Transcript_14752/g.16373 Transcript_14752/m.16373 type:complete len:470 (-) Transcript_14752:113-1522(-)
MSSAQRRSQRSTKTSYKQRYGVYANDLMDGEGASVPTNVVASEITPTGTVSQPPPGPTKKKARRQRRPWTEAEEQTILKFVKEKGARGWAECASLLESRTANQVSYHYKNHLKDKDTKGTTKKAAPARSTKEKPAAPANTATRKINSRAPRQPAQAPPPRSMGRPIQRRHPGAKQGPRVQGTMPSRPPSHLLNGVALKRSPVPAPGMHPAYHPRQRRPIHTKLFPSTMPVPAELYRYMSSPDLQPTTLLPRMRPIPTLKLRQPLEQTPPSRMLDVLDWSSLQIPIDVSYIHKDRIEPVGEGLFPNVADAVMKEIGRPAVVNGAKTRKKSAVEKPSRTQKKQKRQTKASTRTKAASQTEAKMKKMQNKILAQSHSSRQSRRREAATPSKSAQAAQDSSKTPLPFISGPSFRVPPVINKRYHTGKGPAGSSVPPRPMTQITEDVPFGSFTMSTYQKNGIKWNKNYKAAGAQ